MPPARSNPKPSAETAHSHRIRRISVIGGFLDGASLDLNNGLNCIIGARGTGKTTVMELVRFALGATPPNDPEAARRLEALIDRNLDGGRVQLTFETKDGLTYTITRSQGEDPIVLTAAGEPTGLSINAGKGGAGLFKVDIFSQNQIERIADRPAFQLSLIDNFDAERIGSINAQIRAILSSLALNAGQIVPLRARITALTDEAGERAAVEEKLKGYTGVGGDQAKAINQAHALKAQRDRERRALESLKQFLASYAGRLTEVTGQVNAQTGSLLGENTTTGPNASALASLRDALLTTGKDVDESIRQAQRGVERASASVKESSAALERVHGKQEVEFRALIEKHHTDQGQALERSRLEKLRNDLLAKEHARDELAAALKKLETERDVLHKDLSALRDQRFALRRAVADTISEALKTNNIRVTVIQTGDLDAYRLALTEALKPARIKHAVVAQKLASAFLPVDLSAAVTARNAQSLVDQAELNDDQAQKVVECLIGSPVLFELETVELSDLPRIELKDGDEYKPSTTLSTGQKCTAVLPILLLDSDGPLLIDQPEDDLDNRFIFKTVVDSIRRIKGRRQLLFVTHNPNIPVLGDAEKVFVLESNGASGRVAAEGSVEECKLQIVTLLEGGEEAFKQRKQRYSY